VPHRDISENSSIHTQQMLFSVSTVYFLLYVLAISLRYSAMKGPKELILLEVAAGTRLARVLGNQLTIGYVEQTEAE